MPHYIRIGKDGSVVYLGRYPSPEEEGAAARGEYVLLWLEQSPGRVEVRRETWKRVDEDYPD